MLLQLLAHWKTAISAGPGDKVSQHSQIRHYFNDLVFCADHEFYVYLLPINVLTCTQARAYCNSVAWSDLQCFSPPVIRCLSVTGYPSILLGCLNSAPVCIIYFPMHTVPLNWQSKLCTNPLATLPPHIYSKLCTIFVVVFLLCMCACLRLLCSVPVLHVCTVQMYVSFFKYCMFIVSLDKMPSWNCLLTVCQVTKK